MQAPRISYLPILVAEITKHFLEIVLDEATLATLPFDQLWFEAAGTGEALRWHWSIGLLYDYHTSNIMHNETTSSRSQAPRPSGALSSKSNASANLAAPLEIILHFRDPPVEKLAVGSSIDACRANFMNMVKEADYIRWGSTRRVTALRKIDQDALWEGMVRSDFDTFWSIASKLIPSPAPPAGTSTAVERSVSNQSAKSTGSSGGPSSTLDGRLPDATATRSIPVRLYLPEDIPVLQDVVPPVDGDGNASTLYTVLQSQLALIFPARSTSMTNSFLASKPAGKAICQGITVPLDSEIAYLGSTLCSPDGWLHLLKTLEPETDWIETVAGLHDLNIEDGKSARFRPRHVVQCRRPDVTLAFSPTRLRSALQIRARSLVQTFLATDGVSSADVDRSVLTTTSGLQELDAKLNGGYHFGSVYEVSGKASSCRTLLALSATLHMLLENADNRASFIDTEGSFSVERALSILKEVASVKSLPTDDAALMRVLDRLGISRCPTPEALHAVVSRLHQDSCDGRQIVVVDSVYSIYKDRVQANAAQANASLTSLIQSLRLLHQPGRPTCILLINGVLSATGAKPHRSAFADSTYVTGLYQTIPIMSDTTIFLSRTDTILGEVDRSTFTAEIGRSRDSVSLPRIEELGDII